MAAAEARALLDQLMGGDRDAPLPKGAALPRKRNLGADDGKALLLPGKRHKSCYDKDVCHLYCAWGVDVYDLFVNTKSDIGPNPYTADDAARQEYLSLPQHEKDRLGFEFMLFQKLGELVQQCDRTVNRNNEKLNKELQRQLQKRGGQDYVIDVDEAAVEQLCRNQIMVEELTEQVVGLLGKLKEVKEKETAMSAKLVSMAEEKAKVDAEEKENEVEVKKEEDDGEEGSESVKEEPSAGNQTAITKEDGNEESKEVPKENAPPQPSALALELGKITMDKQAILCDISRILGQLGPLQESVEVQSRHLNHVKSDITSDKTVCEVSGNFMSSRDADERIAAHYAGKQYVGWKLVREKLKEMLKTHGKYGPPPPGRGHPSTMEPPPQLYRSGSGGRGGGGYGGDRRGGNRHNDGYRGGRGDRRGGPGPGRWERNGGGGGGYDRGYDNRRGGRQDFGDRYRGGRGNWGGRR